jgi:hypothetical protein
MKPERHSASVGEPRARTQTRALFGMPLRVVTQDGRTELAVAQATRVWAASPEPAAPCLQLSVTVDRTPSGTANVAIDVAGQRLVLSGQGARGHADATSRTADCTVSEAFLLDPDLLREQVLEPLVLFMAARNGRTPIHASGFVLEDIAVLLAGPSGAGKSCLALAADDAGYAVLSDDTVYVERDPLRVWGMSGAAYLLPADSAGVAVSKQRLRAGRLKNVVPLRSAAQHGPRACTRASLCLLTRGQKPALHRIDTGEALARLAKLDSGFDLIRDRVMDAYARLASNGAWELTLSDDPAAAIALLAGSAPILRQSAVS